MVFRISSRLLLPCRITLFTRENCSLCTDAKQSLSAVWDTRPFVFKEVDIMKPGQKGWQDIYEFDVPVIHISKAGEPDENPKLSAQAQKLMHRFKPEEVHEKMDAVQNGTN